MLVYEYYVCTVFLDFYEFGDAKFYILFDLFVLILLILLIL